MSEEFFPTVPSVAEIVQFNFSVLPASYLVKAHLHHFHQLDVILEGDVEIEIEGRQRYAGTVGSAWLIPPLTRHELTSAAGYRQCSFKLRLAARYWPSFGTRFRQFSIAPNLLHDIEKGGQRFRCHAPLANQQISALAVLCLVECLDGIGVGQESGDNLDSFRQMLWPLLEQIENDPQGQWSVKLLATECHMSPDHFSRCFHRIIGQSPQRYLLETRMRASAAELFLEPERPIKEIADRTGYSNVPAFTRAFKRIFDIAPATYRTSHSNHS